jgi:hypothetical protein
VSPNVRLRPVRHSADDVEPCGRARVATIAQCAVVITATLLLAAVAAAIVLGRVGAVAVPLSLMAFACLLVVAELE